MGARRVGVEKLLRRRTPLGVQELVSRFAGTIQYAGFVKRRLIISGKRLPSLRAGKICLSRPMIGSREEHKRNRGRVVLFEAIMGSPALGLDHPPQVIARKRNRGVGSRGRS